MSETELRDRLTATVSDVQAPADLVDRVRAGGSRRVRRRRLTAAATAVTLTAGVAAGVLTTIDRPGSDSVGPADTASVTPTADRRVTPNKADPYGVLVAGPTRGDLAGDKAYLAKAVAIWNDSHDTSNDRSRGIFRFLRGKPKVAWAGRTPAGPAAIVVQQADLRRHDNIQLHREGVYTLIGYVGTDARGRQTLIDDSYPAPGSGFVGGVVTGAKGRTLIVPDLGYQVGWSDRRTYSSDGSSRHEFQPVAYRDGAAVVQLPADVDPGWLLISPLPVPPRPRIDGTLPVIDGMWVAGLPAPTRPAAPYTPFTNEEASWPLTPGAKAPHPRLFEDAVDAANEPSMENGGHNLPWRAYGVTAKGLSLTVGQKAIGPGPYRVYAVLRGPGNGKVTRILSGELSDFKTPELRLVMHLPDGQGWVVAHPGATLSYRVGGGAWSEPRTNATLVPDGRAAQVKATVNGQDRIVDLN